MFDAAEVHTDSVVQGSKTRFRLGVMGREQPICDGRSHVGYSQKRPPPQGAPPLWAKALIHRTKIPVRTFVHGPFRWRTAGVPALTTVFCAQFAALVPLARRNFNLKIDDSSYWANAQDRHIEHILQNARKREWSRFRSTRKAYA